MAKKIRFYDLSGTAVDKDGVSHEVTVVGKFVQERSRNEIKETVPVETRPGCFVNGELRYSMKFLTRRLTIGAAICHPSDDFDKDAGIRIAKKRIEEGEDLGTIMTNDVTMLTEDAIMGELLIKLTHIISNIDEYIC